ncbi:hypothetical protein FGB62_58g13 [Gracilaria domingensis]|nr:hypothetical protein FGB62_58g13 [Gracilaria domingensis]
MLAKSHPYGNGGLDNRIDYTGYDPEAIAKEFEDAKHKFHALVSDPPEELQNIWMVILSTDIIQWDNNLIKASLENGFNWDLRGVSIAPIVERSVRRSLTEESVYVIDTGNQSLLAVSAGEDKKILLTFEKEQEASRFESHLSAEGQDAKKVKLSIEAAKGVCKDKGLHFGIVPERTLVSPMQFGRAPN